jgi:beta-phosphoglucomutase
MNILGKEYALCIFDFDGVILDTEKYHYLAWRDVFASLGITLRPEDYLPLKSTGREHIIGAVLKKFGRTLSDEQKQSISQEKGKRYAAYAAHISFQDLIGGVEPYLQKVRRSGCRAVIATSSLAAKQFSAAFSLEGYFDAVYDAGLPLKKKPAPDVFLHAAKEQGVPPEQCMVFEDSQAGIEGAKNAGMDVIAIGGMKTDCALQCADDFFALI